MVAPEDKLDVIKNIRALSIFLASPSDVAIERQHVRDVVDELNASICRQLGYHITVTGWDTDARPEFGGDGQQVINRQIADMSEHDFFVGIMWNRFGTPTPRAGSGTEEEFELALESFEKTGSPKIMLYFGEMAASLNTEEALTQKGRVIAFRDRVKHKGLIWAYGTPGDFRSEFAKHLTAWLLALPTADTPQPSAKASEGRPVATKSTTRAQVVSSSGDWVLLGTHFIRSDGVTEASGLTQVTFQVGSASDDEFLRSASQGHSQLQFAYQNQAGAAQVIDGRRESGSSGDRWIVGLRVQSEADFYQNMSFNNFTPEKMAMMRARLILLGEQPPPDSFLPAFLLGHDGAILQDGLLRSLWKQLGENRDSFLQLGRLLAVYYLKTTGTVGQIDEFELGPVENGGVKVKFDGRRPRYYSNVEPERISVSGDCPLT